MRGDEPCEKCGKEISTLHKPRMRGDEPISGIPVLLGNT